MAPSDFRPELLLDILLCTGWPPPQRTRQRQASAVLSLRNAALPLQRAAQTVLKN